MICNRIPFLKDKEVALSSQYGDRMNSSTGTQHKLSLKITRGNTVIFPLTIGRELKLEISPRTEGLVLNGYAKMLDRLYSGTESSDRDSSNFTTVISRDDDTTLFELMKIVFFCYSFKVSTVRKVSIGRGDYVNWLVPFDFNHNTRHLDELMDVFEGVDTPAEGVREFLITIVTNTSESSGVGGVEREGNAFYEAYLKHSDEEYVIDDVINRVRKFSYHIGGGGRTPLFTHPSRLFGGSQRVYDSSITFLANYYLYQVSRTGTLENSVGLMLEMFNSMKETEMRIRATQARDAQGEDADGDIRFPSHEDDYLQVIERLSEVVSGQIAVPEDDNDGALDALNEGDEGGGGGGGSGGGGAALTAPYEFASYENLLALDNANAKKVVSEEEWNSFKHTTFSGHKATEEGTVTSLDSCCICTDQFKDDDEITVARCAHFYHTDCIKPWFTGGSNKCPLCKQEVSGGVLASSGGEGGNAVADGENLAEALRNLISSLSSSTTPFNGAVETNNVGNFVGMPLACHLTSHGAPHLTYRCSWELQISTTLIPLTQLPHLIQLTQTPATPQTPPTPPTPPTLMVPEWKRSIDG